MTITLVLADDHPLVLDGIDAVLGTQPDMKVLARCADGEGALAAVSSEDVIEAVRLGVRGVVLKEMAPKLLVNCIRKVHEGGRWLEHASMERALDQLILREAGERELAKILTSRELDVVRCVAQGLRHKEIARRLGVNEGTVKIHLHNAYLKLGVDGRLALGVLLKEKGFA